MKWSSIWAIPDTRDYSIIIKSFPFSSCPSFKGSPFHNNFKYLCSALNRFYTRLVSFNSDDSPVGVHINFLLFKVRKPAQWSAQGHVANKWQAWGLNLGSPVPSVCPWANKPAPDESYVFGFAYHHHFFWFNSPMHLLCNEIGNCLWHWQWVVMSAHLRRRPLWNSMCGDPSLWSPAPLSYLSLLALKSALLLFK